MGENILFFLLLFEARTQQVLLFRLTKMCIVYLSAGPYLLFFLSVWADYLTVMIPLFSETLQTYIKTTK